MNTYFLESDKKHFPIISRVLEDAETRGYIQHWQHKECSGIHYFKYLANESIKFLTHFQS